MDIYFYLILGIATTAGIGFSVITRGILYHTPDTDNELMAYAAAQSHKWRWPSNVHKYGAGKTRMKDVSIFMLAVFQRIFRNNSTDYPYMFAAGFCVSLSGILIYIITANYFSPAVGLLAGFLYLCCFWPWQISLYGGHVNIGTLFFLLSVWALQWPVANGTPAIVSFAIAGTMLSFSLFSSPSSNKYLPVFFGASIYARFLIVQQGQASTYFYSYIPTSVTNITLVFLPIAAVSVWLFLWLNQKWFATKLYYKKLPGPFKQIITGQDLFPLEYYFPVIRRKLKTVARLGSIVVLIFLIMLGLIGPQLLVASIAGFMLGAILITFPDVKKNIANQIKFLIETPRKTHFRAYIDYYAKRGVVIPRNMRGVGLKWLPRVFWKFVPFHFLIFGVSFIYLAGNALISYRLDDLIKTILIATIALSPIIWAEITRAPQASRLYSPALITMVILVSYATYQVQPLLHKYWYLPVSTLAVIATWNLFIFIKDIYPSRMAARNLLREIRRRNIKDIYTYQTSYNNSMIMNIPGLSHSTYLPHKDIKPPFNVHFIKSLSDIVDGWVVIPPTSSKNFTMSCEPEAMIDDYTKDPLLNALLKNRALDQVATVRFSTYGSSRFWVNEDDITSWRSLIRQEIGPEDLYRGYGWLIHGSKIKPLISATP